MKDKKNDDITRIKAILSFSLIFLFWVLLGSSLSSLFYIVSSFFNSNFLESPIYKYLYSNIPFLAMAIGLSFSLKYIMNMRLKELITMHSFYNKRYFFISFIVSILYLSIYLIISKVTGYKEIIFLENSIKERLIILPIVLIFTSLQASLEEILFRGIILKILLKEYKTKNISRSIIYSIIVGLIFILPHLSNPEIKDNLIYSLLYYFIFGFGSSFITLYFGTLEIAISLHIANNLFIAIICNYENSALKSVPLFIEKTGNNKIFDLIVLILILSSTFVLLKANVFNKIGKNGNN